MNYFFVFSKLLYSHQIKFLHERFTRTSIKLARTDIKLARFVKDFVVGQASMSDSSSMSLLFVSKRD